MVQGERAKGLTRAEHDPPTPADVVIGDRASNVQHEPDPAAARGDHTGPGTGHAFDAIPVVAPEPVAAQPDAVRQMDRDQEELEVPGQGAAATTAMGPAGGATPPEVLARLHARRGAGHSLGSASGSTLVAQGGALPAVRVHDDAEAGAMARRLGAAAFTAAHDIYVDSEAAPAASAARRAVIAHELTHIRQQQGVAPDLSRVAPADDQAEREADAGITPELAAQRYESARSALVENHPAAVTTDRAAGIAEPAHAASTRALSPLGQIRRMSRASTPIPAVRTVAADATVSAALTSAWNDSNPNAPDVQRGTAGSTKKEQGGWIIWNSSTGAYRVDRVGAGTRDGLGTIVGTRPSPASPEYLVAWFHTHPNKVSEGYANGPSQPDRDYTTGEAKVPGIVKAHDGLHYIDYP